MDDSPPLSATTARAVTAHAARGSLKAAGRVISTTEVEERLPAEAYRVLEEAYEAVASTGQNARSVLRALSQSSSPKFVDAPHRRCGAATADTLHTTTPATRPPAPHRARAGAAPGEHSQVTIETPGLNAAKSERSAHASFETPAAGREVVEDLLEAWMEQESAPYTKRPQYGHLPTPATAATSSRR